MKLKPLQLCVTWGQQLPATLRVSIQGSQMEREHAVDSSSLQKQQSTLLVSVTAERDSYRQKSAQTWCSQLRWWSECWWAAHDHNGQRCEEGCFHPYRRCQSPHLTREGRSRPRKYRLYIKRGHNETHRSEWGSESEWSVHERLSCEGDSSRHGSEQQEVIFQI